MEKRLPPDAERLALLPPWQGDTMHDESLLMVADEDGSAEADLLFEPDAIVSVRSARRDRIYEEGRDWVLAGGKLRLTANSRIPRLTGRELYPDEETPNGTMPRIGGGYVIYREGSYFHDRQINVTYTHAPGAWTGPVPSFAGGGALAGAYGKLRAGAPLKAALFGDSIAVGANASGWSGAPPYLPPWGELFRMALERRYDAAVTLINRSLGGANAEWGASRIGSLVAPESPDLVLIAFGMNDGAGAGVAPDAFKARIEAMIASVRAVNPSAEFVLVGTTLANPLTPFANVQPAYIAELEAIAAAGEGIATADMTGVHAKLLERKRFADMTGNHINHPNDFLTRWYAAFAAGLLVPQDAD